MSKIYCEPANSPDDGVGTVEVGELATIPDAAVHLVSAAATPPADARDTALEWDRKESAQRTYLRTIQRADPGVSDPKKFGCAFVAFLPSNNDEKMVISAHKSGIVQLWSWNSVSKPLAQLLQTDGFGEVSALAVIPVTEGALWDIAVGGIISHLSDGKRVKQAAVAVFSLSCTPVAAAGTAAASAWTFRSKFTTSLAAVHAKAITSLLMSDYIGGRLVVVGSQDNTKNASVWTMAPSGQLHVIRKLFNGHTDQVLCVSLFAGYQRTLDSMVVVTGGWDKSLRFWPLSSTTDDDNLCHPVGKPLIGHTKMVTCMVMHRVSMRERDDSSVRSYDVLITGSGDKSAIVWDYNERTKMRQLSGHKERITSLAAFQENLDSPPLVLTGSEDRTVIVWDLMSGHAIRTLTSHTIMSVCCTYDKGQGAGGMLIVTGGMKGSVQFWDLTRTERTVEFGGTALTNGNTVLRSAVTGLATYRHWESDTHVQTHLFISDVSGKVVIHNITESPTRSDTTPSPALVNQLSDQRLNNVLVCVAPPAKESVEQPLTLPNPSPFFVACDGGGHIYSYQLDMVRVATTNAAFSLASRFSPKTKLTSRVKVNNFVVFALAFYDPRRVRDHEGLLLVNSLPEHLRSPMIICGGGDPYNITFWEVSVNDDGDAVIASTAKFTICEAHTDELVRTLAVHLPVVDGHAPKLVSGSWDKTAKIWDLSKLVKGENNLTPIVLNEHKGSVMLVYIYDPFDHLGSGGTRPDLFTYTSPVVITGSYDHTVMFWNLNDGKRTNSLIGHSDSVTAMDLYVPKSAKEPPLLVTGGIDRLIMVWNVWTAERVHTLVGHKDRVCCLHVHRPVERHSQAWLASGGDDRLTFIWKDALYSKPFMPLSDAVQRTFTADLEVNDWPLMTYFAGKYKVALFLENTNLFYEAIEHNRADFLLKFRTYLSECIRHTEQERHREQFHVKSLLQCAIDKEDLISVRIILLCWVENLNRDILDLLTQHVFHACHFFWTLTELKHLSRQYPREYNMFICALQLVRNHSSLMGSTTTHWLHKRHRYEVACTNELAPKFDVLWMKRLSSAQYVSAEFASFCMQFGKIVHFLFHRLWSNVDGKVTNHDVRIYLHPFAALLFVALVSAGGAITIVIQKLWQCFATVLSNGLMWCSKIRSPSTAISPSKAPVVVSLLLPLRCPFQLSDDVYGAMLDASNEMKSLQVFNSVVAIYSSQYVWHDYGRFLHFAISGHFIIFIILFVVFIHAFQDEERHDTVGSICFVVVLVAYLLFCLVKEVVQVFRQHGGCKDVSDFFHKYFTKHLRDFWNFMDATVIVSGIVGLLLSLHSVSITARCMFAWCSVAMWIRLLYFFRPFSNAGPLVVMVLRIAWDIRYFVVVLFCFLMGFSQAFWLLSYQDKSLPFGKFSTSLLNTYYYILGVDIETDFHDTAAPALATFFLVVFTLIMMILMLNLLIALMNNTYTIVCSEESAPWRKERIAVIREHALDTGIQLTPNKFVHVLKYASDVASIHDTADKEELIKAVNDCIELLLYPFKPFDELEQDKVEEKLAEGQRQLEKELQYQQQQQVELQKMFDKLAATMGSGKL